MPIWFFDIDEDGNEICHDEEEALRLGLIDVGASGADGVIHWINAKPEPDKQPN